MLFGCKGTTFSAHPAISSPHLHHKPVIRRRRGGRFLRAACSRLRWSHRLLQLPHGRQQEVLTNLSTLKFHHGQNPKSLRFSEPKGRWLQPLHARVCTGKPLAVCKIMFFIVICAKYGSAKRSVRARQKGCMTRQDGASRQAKRAVPPRHPGRFTAKGGRNRKANGLLPAFRRTFAARCALSHPSPGENEMLNRKGSNVNFCAFPTAQPSVGRHCRAHPRRRAAGALRHSRQASFRELLRPGGRPAGGGGCCQP